VPKVGDVVVTMSYTGLFTVVTVDGDQLTIADDTGRTMTVRSANVRHVRRDDAPR
jgi:hypothetical protein